MSTQLKYSYDIRIDPRQETMDLSHRAVRHTLSARGYHNTITAQDGSLWYESDIPLDSVTIGLLGRISSVQVSKWR